MILGRGTSTSDGQVRRAGQRDMIKVVVALAVIGLVVLLAVDNRQQVTVGWLVDESDLPLYLLFGGTFALGIVVGLLLRVRRRQHR